MILDQKPKGAFCCLEKPSFALGTLWRSHWEQEKPHWIPWLFPGAEPAWLGPRLWEKKLQHLKTSSLPCTQLTAAASRNINPHQHHPKWNLEAGTCPYWFFLFLILIIFKMTKLSLAENKAEENSI